MTQPEDSIKYRPLASTAATLAISSIGKEFDGSSLIFDYAGKKVEIVFTSGTITFVFTTKKLLDYMLLHLTRFNSNKKKEPWKNATICFSLRNYMDVMGYDSTSRQARNRCFDTICADMDKLRSVKLRQETGDCFGLVEAYRFVGPEGTEYAKQDIGPKGKKYVKKDVVADKAAFEVAFQPSLLTHLNEHRRIVPFPIDLFRHAGQNENAYALAKRMILHYSSNRSSKNQDKLKVATLLQCCPDKANQHTGNIRDTFEKALNRLASPTSGGSPLICWTYIIKGKHYTSDEVTAMGKSHEDWLELVVYFDPIGLHVGKKFADADILDTAFRPSSISFEDERVIMRKKKTDPKLHTPNAFVQKQMGHADVNIQELEIRQFESRICEQIWIVRKAPPKFIRSLRDENGYLGFEDLTFPMELLMDQEKKLSLSDCITEPMPRLLWDPLFEEEERILAVTKWFGGNGPYAQVGILKYSDDALQGHVVESLIKRDHEGHVYYLGRFFDLLTAMSDAGLLPPWEDEYGNADETDTQFGRVRFNRLHRRSCLGLAACVHDPRLRHITTDAEHRRCTARYRRTRLRHFPRRRWNSVAKYHCPSSPKGVAVTMGRDEKLEVAGQAVTHGLQGGLVSAAASIVTGVGVGSVTTSTPVTILWGLITVGTSVATTPIWLPSVIAGATITGAVVAGTASAAVAYQRIKSFNVEWNAICGEPDE